VSFHAHHAQPAPAAQVVDRGEECVKVRDVVVGAKADAQAGRALGDGWRADRRHEKAAIQQRLGKPDGDIAVADEQRDDLGRRTGNVVTVLPAA